MNAGFGPGAVNEIGPDVAEMYNPGSGNTLVEALRATPRLDLSDAVLGFIDTWPGAIQASVMGAIHHNLTREAKVPITFAWQPAYDFSVTLHDVTDTANSVGGMTMLFTSRYPDDTHPLSSIKR